MDLKKFLRNLALWIVPVAAVWWLLTPAYNRFLIGAGENLIRIFESPDVTDLGPKDAHYTYVLHREYRSGPAGQVRVTDLHFPLALMAVLFLAVPGVALKERFRRLGLATLVSVFFHLLLLALWVRFLYSTQLGEWSLERYSPLARESWGMAKHVADLPVKLALPLVLWGWFYLDQLLGPRRDGPEDAKGG